MKLRHLLAFSLVAALLFATGCGGPCTDLEDCCQDRGGPCPTDDLTDEQCQDRLDDAQGRGIC